MPSIKKILCPVDFMQHSGMIAEYAAMVAKSFGAEVEVIYASFTLSLVHEDFTLSVQAGELEDTMYKSSTEKMDTFLKKHFAGVKATGTVKRGDPSDEILVRAKQGDIDLIIMGTHGRKGFDLLLFGSVAEKVVRMSPVPVLTVRPKQ